MNITWSGGICIFLLLSLCNTSVIVFQLRQSQSYCTDTDCPQERTYGFVLHMVALHPCLQIRNIGFSYMCGIYICMCVCYLQYQVPVGQSAEEGATWHSLWSSWDGWCWLWSCSCCAHPVSGPPAPQASLLGPKMSVMYTHTHIHTNAKTVLKIAILHLHFCLPQGDSHLCMKLFFAFAVISQETL